MAITEESRHHLFQALERLLGPEEAATLMEHLPPVGWADVATRADLDHLATVIGLRIDASEANLRSELRGAIGTTAAELQGDLADLGQELRVEMAAMRSDLQRSIDGVLAGQMAFQRQMSMAIFVALVSLVAATITVG